MLKETAKKYWSEEYDLNCAECIMYAANEEYINIKRCTLMIEMGVEILEDIILIQLPMLND